MSENMNALSWSLMMYLGMHYLVITLSMRASISSNFAWYIGTAT